MNKEFLYPFRSKTNYVFHFLLSVLITTPKTAEGQNKQINGKMKERNEKNSSGGNSGVNGITKYYT